MFDVKDPFPCGLCMGVVCKILCAGCHVYYVGETTWPRLFKGWIKLSTG